MTNNVNVYGPELEYLCKEGDINKVHDLIKNGSKYTNDLNTKDFSVFNYGLKGACEGGNLQIVELMISKGANFFNYLYSACKGKSKNKSKVVYILISHGANNLYDGLCGACESGDKNLVKFMISKIKATKPFLDQSCRKNLQELEDWIYLIYSTCENGHPDIADLLVVYSYVSPIHKLLPKEYYEYKQAQVLKFTKIHEFLIDMILKKI